MTKSCTGRADSRLELKSRRPDWRAPPIGETPGHMAGRVLRVASRSESLLSATTLCVHPPLPCLLLVFLTWGFVRRRCLHNSRLVQCTWPHHCSSRARQKSFRSRGGRCLSRHQGGTKRLLYMPHQMYAILSIVLLYRAGSTPTVVHAGRPSDPPLAGSATRGAAGLPCELPASAFVGTESGESMSDIYSYLVVNLSSVRHRHLHHLRRTAESAEEGSRQERQYVRPFHESLKSATFIPHRHRLQSEDDMQVVTKLANDYINFCKECCMYASVSVMYYTISPASKVLWTAKYLPYRTTPARC